MFNDKPFMVRQEGIFDVSEKRFFKVDEYLDKTKIKQLIDFYKNKGYALREIIYYYDKDNEYYDNLTSSYLETDVEGLSNFPKSYTDIVVILCDEKYNLSLCIPNGTLCDGFYGYTATITPLKKKIR